MTTANKFNPTEEYYQYFSCVQWDNSFSKLGYMEVKMFFKTVKQRFRQVYGTFAGRLANKLAFIFSRIVSIFIIALIMISYYRTSDILTNDFIENNKSILKLVCQSFDSYIQQIDELSLTLRKNESERIISILLGNSNNYQNDRYIQDQIQNLFNSRQDIEEVKFYIPSSKKEYYISKKYAKVSVRYEIDKQNTQWLKDVTMGTYYRNVETGLKNSNNQEPEKDKVFFTFSRALINIADQKALGVVSISFNYSMMEKINWNEYGQNGEILSLFDKDNQLFYCSDPSLADTNEIDELLKNVPKDITNGSFKVKINDKNYLVVYSTPAQSEWKSVKLIPIDTLNQKVRQTRNISLLIGIIFVIIFVALIIFISNMITRSLHRLSKHMDKVGKGNFKTKAIIVGSDETAQLAGKFNFMVEQIDELVNEKYIAKISEKIAQIKALEAQINPHFLYNSLQAIASKAVLSGNKDISRMVEALAHSFRYCIKGGDMVMVSAEIEHINNYLVLHKARFEDRLLVEIIVEDGTPAVMIPKLSIQTLVENAIKHCIEHITSAVTIKIHTYIDLDNVIIQVTDNGPGMTEERLQEIRNELSSNTWNETQGMGIGLKNLNLRLKLMYDNDASLELESSLHCGTEIKIILPVKSKGDIQDV